MKKVFFVFCLFFSIAIFSQKVYVNGNAVKVSGKFRVSTPIVVPTCSDGIQNGDETGVDCGGSCTACVVVSDCTPSGSPTDVSNLSELLAVSNGTTVRIINGFSATGATFPADLVIMAGGGVISGTDIGLNNACIYNEFQQIFASSARFREVNENSFVSAEVFGAVSGDANDDNNSIEALIVNCSKGIGQLNGSYIKNNDSYITRFGTFEWDGNGASLEITSTSGFPMSSVSTGAVFEVTNLSMNVYDWEFDGNGLYGRLFYFHGQQSIIFKDNYVHDLYSPNAIRCVAFRFTINVSASGFDYCEFDGNTIDNVVAQGDGNYNDGGGISKVWWWTVNSLSGADFEVIYRNNVVTNIIGDDAEAFYAIGGASTTHTGTWLFDNEDYRYCTRRAIKFCTNNVEIRNSYFEEIPESMFSSAQQMGSMLDFFSTSSGSLLQNVYVHDNVIRTVPNENAHYYLLAVTDATNVDIVDNVFTMENLHTYGGIRLGSNTATYSGYLQDVVVHGNTLNNTYVQAMLYYDPINPIDVNNNIFNFTSTLGYDIGAFRFYGSGTKGNVDFVDNDININMGSASGVNGVISSDSQVTGVVDFNIDNATVTITNAVPTRSFGYLQSNFNNTNTIQNSTIIGDTGTGSVVVTGTGGVVITNSSGDGSSPITQN